MFFFIGFAICVAAMIICPIIGLIMSRDKHPKMRIHGHIDIKEKPIRDGLPVDHRQHKDLGELFDNRDTNIFRPWGGLFGD